MNQQLPPSVAVPVSEETARRLLAALESNSRQLAALRRHIGETTGGNMTITELSVITGRTCAAVVAVAKRSGITVRGGKQKGMARIVSAEDGRRIVRHFAALEGNPMGSDNVHSWEVEPIEPEPSRKQDSGTRSTRRSVA